MNFKFNNNNRNTNDNTDDKNEKNNKNYDKIKKILKAVLIGAAILLGLFIFLNYLFMWFLPFIIAWVIAFFIQPIVNLLNKKLRIPKKIATVFVLLLIFAVIGSVIFLIIDRIVYELMLLSRTFTIDGDEFTNYINDFFVWLENLLDKIPFLSGNNIIDQIRIQIENMADKFVSELGVKLATQAPSTISSIITTLPSILVFTLILIISTFYICLDYATINKFLMIQIPTKVRDIIFEVKNRFLEAIYKYLRAYMVIVFITYFELAVGFLIIGVKYAFILAFFVAIVDIFPIVGTGTVLIPWGIINILQKDYFTGFALLILYATVTVIRQVIEPRIVGRSIGLYPVVTLIALYVGYNIFGLFGMIMLPVCILLLKNLNDEGRIRLWKSLDKDTDPNKIKTKSKFKKNKEINKNDENTKEKN